MFTGIGGLDWGLEKIGAKCAGFAEIRKSSTEIYKKHYPDHVNYGDVTKINFKELPDFDILTGGFPCQSFSLAGLGKGFKDRRGKMIFYIYDILRIKQPSWVVLENVTGLLTHEEGRTYESVFKLLMSAGYHVRVLCLNSLYYGSAQSRERLVFLCQRDKDFPRVRPGIEDDTKRFRDVREPETGEFQYVELNERNTERLEGRSQHFSFVPVGGYDRIKTLLTMKHGDQRRPCVVQEPDGRYRYLTILEAERLQLFPDGWTAGQSEANRWFAVGNAVNCGMSEYLFTKYLPKVWWN